MKARSVKTLLGTLLLLLGASLAAQEPITIEADRMELDQSSGINHYRGHVVMVRGTLQINSDSLLLYTKGRQLQRIVAEGDPVELQQQGEEGEREPMRATARYMEYQPNTEALELKGAARLWRAGNEFSGEQIHYNLKQQTVKAAGEQGDGGGRVRVLLVPESAETTPVKEEQ